MNDKEFNLQILAALTEYANGLVAAGRVTVEEDGQYTAYNLAKRKNDMGEPLHVNITERNEPTTLHVGGFTCTVTPYTVFGLICKFESICKVKASGKVRFKFGNGCDAIIREKAMFADSNGKVKTQKIALKKQAGHTANDKQGRMFYQVKPGGVWYYITNAAYATVEGVENNITVDFVRNGIKYVEGKNLPIYEALLAELEANEPTEETTPDEQSTPKRKQGTRFTFSACGIKPGEQVTFTPEDIEVTVADDTHVKFCGELFTLSGFCRAFMPDNKRKSSNAYQGPKYFTYNGVSLMKLRAEKAGQETDTEKAVTRNDFAQERAKQHELPTGRTDKNKGLKRIILRVTSVCTPQALTVRPFVRIRPKCATVRNVVHTLPLPPPKTANKYGI